MPWTANWLGDEQRVIVLEPRDPWTWDELSAATEQAQAMTAAQPHTVDLIYRLGDDFKLPDPDAEGQRVTPWMPLRDMLMKSPANRGLIVLESAPLFVESVISVLKSVMKNEAATDNIVYAATMREAQDLIRSRRAARHE